MRSVLRRVSEWVSDHLDTIGPIWAVGLIAIIGLAAFTDAPPTDPLIGTLLMVWLAPFYLALLWAIGAYVANSLLLLWRVIPLRGRSKKLP